MAAVWGNKVRYTIFGESHGTSIGMVIDGLPAGFLLDQDWLRREMARRAPGSSDLTTPRVEGDEVTIVSGLYQGKTDGSPLCGMIQNTNTRSSDYAAEPRVFRPGHADYTGFVKYGGCNDPRGGGHFSGRLTAPLVFAGAIGKQLLLSAGIEIGAHIAQIGSIQDAGFDPVHVDSKTLAQLRQMSFPVLAPAVADGMQQVIRSAKEADDSVGGVIEAAVCGLPAGLGTPFFDSVESVLAHLLFSIPAVKAVEFGAGFGFAGMLGSQANDEMTVEAGNVRTVTNHNGGVLGGITNGMPLLFRAAVKPTPSIAKEQTTLNAKNEAVSLSITGRHDPCIIPRAVPVIEAVAAMAVWDML